MKILCFSILSFFSVAALAQVGDTSKTALIGRLVRKEVVQIDSSKIDSYSEEQRKQILAEVNKVRNAPNVMVRLLDEQNHEIGTAVSNRGGLYTIESNIPVNKIYYLCIYGNGPEQPPTRRRPIYVAHRDVAFLPKYDIKEY